MQMLSREYELITLWVSVLSQRGEPSVSVRLEATVDGQRETLFSPDPIPVREFGLPANGEPLAYATPRVAPSLIRELASWSEQENQENRPLWIALIPPSGHLGVVPWEVDLVPALNVPVLRLPDFLEPQRETTSVLDVAVICSVPLGVSKGPIRAPELDRVVESLLDAAPSRRVAVHLFCDDATASAMSPQLRSKLTVYTSPSRPDSASYRGRGNPWFDWVTSEMDGNALDAVHFIAHGVCGSSGGMVALAAAPGRNETGGVYASAREVSEFLTRNGAWSVGFHLPASHQTDVGLRSLADGIGAVRPGSVLYHDATIDREALGPALRLMYGTPPLPVPLSPSLFLYIQPRQVEGPGSAGPADSAGQSSRYPEWESDLPSEYLNLFAKESLPVYVAQNERIADQVKVFLGREPSPGEPAPAPEVSDAVSKAMSALHAYVANYAVESEAQSSMGAVQ